MWMWFETLLLLLFLPHCFVLFPGWGWELSLWSESFFLTIWSTIRHDRKVSLFSYIVEMLEVAVIRWVSLTYGQWNLQAIRGDEILECLLPSPHDIYTTLCRYVPPTVFRSACLSVCLVLPLLFFCQYPFLNLYVHVYFSISLWVLVFVRVLVLFLVFGPFACLHVFRLSSNQSLIYLKHLMTGYLSSLGVLSSFFFLLCVVPRMWLGGIAAVWELFFVLTKYWMQRQEGNFAVIVCCREACGCRH